MCEPCTPHVLEPKPGVVYTPREKRKAVVVYRSVMDSVHDAETPEEGNALLRDYMDCTFGYVELEEIERKHRVTIRSWLANTDAAADRYDEACANGKRGGRPRLELDREQLERDYAALGSWEKVAEKHGISFSTLYRERMRWTENRSTGQNLTYTNTKTKTNTSTNTKTTARPAGRSAARGAGVSEEALKKASKQTQQAFSKLRQHQEQQKQNSDPNSGANPAVPV